MNILYALNSGGHGGMEQHVLDLVEGMVSQKNTVYVFCKDGPMVELYEKAGAQVYIREILFDIDPFYIFNCFKFIKVKHIDIVHAHELKACVNAGLAAKIAGKIGLITNIHTPMSEWQDQNKLKSVFIKLESKLYALFVNLFGDYEIALTHSRSTIKIIEGLKPTKIKIIPNGIKALDFTLTTELKQAYRTEMLAQLKIPQNTIIFGNVGRMTTEKGLDLLLKAFAQVLKQAKQKREIYLVLAGGGILEAKLKKLSTELEISEKVIFTGIFDPQDKKKFYSTFDYFIFPSLAEGFGIVLMEALVSEVLAISSDLAVLKEITANKGIYFKTGDYMDLARKMEETMELSTDRKNAISSALLTYISSNYSYDNFLLNYQSLYESITSR